MSTGQAARDRDVVHLVLVAAAVVPLLALGWMTMVSWKTPLVPVPGVRQAQTIAPNAITDHYLTTFAQSWLTRRHTLNAYNYESVAVAIADDCTPQFRGPFLQEAVREFQRYKALERSSSGIVDQLVIEPLGDNTWTAHYHLTDVTFYGPIKVGRAEHAGRLIITLADQHSSQRPVQIADDILESSTATPSPTRAESQP